MSPIVERFVKALKLECRPSSWMNCLLERNGRTWIHKMDGLFLASFFEAQSSIPRHYKQHFTRKYVCMIKDDNPMRWSQELYFASKLVEVGCLKIRLLVVNCVKQMSRDLQARVMKVICSAERIFIQRLPGNFDGKLFAQTYSQLSSGEPPKKRLTYMTIIQSKHFKSRYLWVDNAEELAIYLRIECCVEETIEMINAMKTIKSMTRIEIVDCERATCTFIRSNEKRVGRVGLRLF